MALSEKLQKAISGTTTSGEGTKRVLEAQKNAMKANSSQSTTSQSGNSGSSGSSSSTKTTSVGSASSSGSSTGGAGKTAGDIIKQNNANKNTSVGSAQSNSGSQSTRTGGFYDTSHNVKVNGVEMSGDEYATYKNLMDSGDAANWDKARAMYGGPSTYTYNNGTWTATGETRNYRQGSKSGTLGGEAGQQLRISNPSTFVGAQYTFTDALNDATGNPSSSRYSDDDSAEGFLMFDQDDYLNRNPVTYMNDSSLPQNTQTIINQAKREWQEAYNRGDQAGMQQARDKAEKARNAVGYYSSADGSQLFKIDQNYVDAKTKELSDAWFATNDPAERARLHNEAEYYRGLLGYSGGADGSQRISTGNQQYQGTPDYTGMSYQEKYAAAQAAGDTYGMAEAANDAYNDRYNNQGVYRGVDGAQTPVNVAPVLREITNLKSQLSEAQSRRDNTAITQLTKQIKDSYASIGRVWADDGNDYSITELNLRIEQDKRAWWERQNTGDFAGADQAHQDAVWCDKQLGYMRNADGTQRVRIQENIVSAGANDGNTTNVSIGSDGEPTAVLNPDGTINTDYRGLINTTNGANATQYIVTTDDNGGQKFVKVVESVPEFYVMNPDGSLNYGRITDSQGNELNASNFVYGEDNRCYDRVTGENLTDLAARYGLDPTNFVMKMTYSDGSEKYFNLYGQDVSGRLDVVQREDIQDYENKNLNELTNSILGAGFNNVPQWNDYNSLTWDQALAMAEEQVNGAFSKQLDTTLDKLNTSALQTGFYGQLPAEQLRQNAIAESEVERQQAIYELANQLQAASQTEAQRQFTDAMQTSQQRLNTVVTVFQQLYQYVRDKVSDMQQEEQFEIQRGNQNIQREANRLQAFMGTFEAWANLMGYAIQATVPTQSGTSPQAVNAVNKYGSMDISKWGDQFIKNTLATMS